jgi:hypothetical protein
MRGVKIKRTGVLSQPELPKLTASMQLPTAARCAVLRRAMHLSCVMLCPPFLMDGLLKTPKAYG